MSQEYDDFKYEVVSENSDSLERQKNWNTAFGLQAVDGLTPSDYMISLAAENVKGEKSYEQVSAEISYYYSSIKDSKSINQAEREADLVSVRIYEILNDESFIFSPMTLKAYHKHLFFGVDIGISGKYIGEYRDYNISKKEPILNGLSVQYASHFMISDTLKYDFDEERTHKYANMNESEIIQHISEFTSRIWQVHPFAEGNTRTTAVFTQKYLNSLGFNVDNELFKDNSLYFRNALVRANYSNIRAGINSDRQYLDAFFEVLLRHKQLSLDNSKLYLSYSQEQKKSLAIDNGVLIKYTGNEEQPIIPESVKIIGDRAFMGNTSIKHIEIPDTVECIGKQAFEGCINLKTASIPKTCDCDITAFPRSCNVRRKDYGGLNSTLKYD